MTYKEKEDKYGVQTDSNERPAITPQPLGSDTGESGSELTVRYNKYVQEIRFKLLKPETTQQWESMASQLLRTRRKADYHTWTELTELWLCLNNKYMWASTPSM